MFGVTLLLLLLSIIGLVWGLIAPHHIAKAARIKRPITRKHTGIGFAALIFVIFAWSVAIAPPSQNTTNLQQTSLKTNAQSSSNNSQPKQQTPTVTTQQETETQSIPYTTQDQNDSSLAKGQTQVAQQGQNGTETLTYKVTYTNGKQTSKTLVSTTATTQPVTQIVDVGTYVAPAPAPSPSPAPSPAPAQSCYPLTNGGNCYEPGEYCRSSDHGATGLAGDGESIVCADNNGWRWEPQ